MLPCQHQSVKSTQHMHGSPFLVSVSPASTNPTKSLVIGQGTTEGIAGKNSLMSILLRDSCGNFVFSATLSAQN